MPWDCKSCSAHVATEDPACPECGASKTSWTLAPNRTRTMVLGRKKVSCLRGGPLHTAPLAADDPAPYAGVAWEPTGVAYVMDRREAARLVREGLLPAARHLLKVRLRPGKLRPSLSLEVPFETVGTEEHEVELGPLEDGAVEQLVLFVFRRGCRLVVRVHVEPGAEASQDDRFVLRADGEFAPQERTVADDLTPHDPYTDLLFSDLDPSLRYTLEVDPGAEGEPYPLFQDVPYAELDGFAARAEDRPPAPPPEGEDAGLAFPGILVVDVGEDSPLGYAPAVDVVGLNKRPVTLETCDRERGVVLRLHVDPGAEASQDDRFTLLGSSAGWEPQTRTVADDLTPDDEYTDLYFAELDPAASYSLQVDPGGGAAPYLLFEDVPFRRLGGLGPARS